MMVKVFIALFFCLLPFFVLAQTPKDTLNIVDVDTTGKRDLLDIANSLFKFKPRKYHREKKKQLYFSVLPLSTSVPGGSKALVTSTTAGYYLGDRKTTYLSSITFAPYFNLKGRYGLPIHSSTWLKNNSYNIQGDIRFLVYPQYTWGLGGKRAEEDKILLNYDYVRFYQNFLKRITPSFYAGIGYNMDYYINIRSNNPAMPLSDFSVYPYGVATGDNSFSSGLTLDVLYDSRQNSFNPIPGSFINVIYRFNTKVVGSDNNSQSIYIDVRKYVSLNHDGPKSQLAFWSFYWRALGIGTPYLSLPSIGNDPYQRSGRGIEQNRYRGENLFYFETEYRGDITHNGLLGFVVFANLNSAGQPTTRRFDYWAVAGGTGLRIKFNKKSNTNICLDYGMSKGYSNITIALGEAF